MAPRDPSMTTAEDFDQMHDSEHVKHEMRTKKVRKEGVAQLNMTSMMDVCFQLLIFFVLTANFTVNEGILPADLPQGTAPNPDTVPPIPQTPIRITMTTSGGDSIKNVTILMDGAAPIQEGNFNRVYELLAGWLKEGNNMPDNPIIIDPKRDVPWGAVVAAFNTCLRAEYTNINFAPASN